MAFQSSLGDEFANEPSRVEQDLRDGLLTITNVAPELTRRFVLIVRESNQTREVCSPTALAWHNGLSQLHRNTRKRQTRFPFIYFHRHFTDCHTIAPPSLLPTEERSFLHSNSRLYFNHQECGSSLFLSLICPGQVLR